MVKKDETLIKGEDFLKDGVYKSFELVIDSAKIDKRENEGGVKEGLLIYFKGAKKPFFAPIDQLNYRMIRTELGTIEPREMTGKRLTLIPVKGDWFGESNTLAVRVMVTGDKPRPRVGKKAFGTSVVGLKVGSFSAKPAKVIVLDKDSFVEALEACKTAEEAAQVEIPDGLSEEDGFWADDLKRTRIERLAK